MDIELIKKEIVVNVYHIPANEKVPMHKHAKNDEIFYCMKGTGSGILEDRQVELIVGQTFSVPAGTMHSLRTDSEIYVASFLVPIVEDAAT